MLSEGVVSCMVFAEFTRMIFSAVDMKLLFPFLKVMRRVSAGYFINTLQLTL